MPESPCFSRLSSLQVFTISAVGKLLVVRTLPIVRPQRRPTKSNAIVDLGYSVIVRILIRENLNL